MKILILGGTGLISTGITRLLLERGDEVVHYNRGQRSQEFAGQVKTITGDRYDHAAFEAQVAELPLFDCVLDMIGYAPEDVHSLLRAFSGKTGHLIFCSTVDVYARPASTYPVTTEEPFRPAAWDYAQKKAVCEIILWDWYEREGHPFTVIRPVHTYSERGAVLHSFGGSSYHLDRLMKGKPIIVHGDGSSLWSSVHRDDAAVAFVNALGNPIAFGKSYHLPGDECITWNQYHARVAEGIGAPPPQIVHLPTDLLYALDKRAFITAINFQYNNCFDSTAAKADLGYRYRTTIAQGAKQVYDWHVANGRLEDSDSVPQDDRILAAWEQVCKRLTADFAAAQG
ncbi:MAG TPA: NAD-dependent epimerase/dehydratase family protein [Chthonomonadaceae bacterium]|nr:NAD-dependent epimerase/dehydratase family protein [Chthonomonadaceae bacterium]